MNHFPCLPRPFVTLTDLLSFECSAPAPGGVNLQLVRSALAALFNDIHLWLCFTIRYRYGIQHSSEVLTVVLYCKLSFIVENISWNFD